MALSCEVSALMSASGAHGQGWLQGSKALAQELPRLKPRIPGFSLLHSLSLSLHVLPSQHFAQLCCNHRANSNRFFSSSN